MRFLIALISLIFFSVNLFALNLKSSVFENGGYIPSRYTCDGKSYSPPLSWDDLPRGVKSFVLIVDDPDAPAGIWVHWVLYNIPASLKKLGENIDKEKMESLGLKQGKNDFGQIGYNGPCPPPGPAHKYSFKLYALDKEIKAGQGVTKPELIEQMQGHIIAETKLSGFYQRQEKRKGEGDGKN
ncbi:MAG: YbhB/YbcL family Raf kinase inhibitor-like protein [Candidatus Omnitrophica bacterium]|nr:YbhB/YbcL family Raf kinase inhibitor-like protein [Candidatus Omnitrophota bacterium]MCF7892007.1 YbhB/YbcL family Raf kinase inhibitor-like protein [Candidatus Omnitrophota bacterium]MCF7896007.1 YbhB/YbcL family Raf kinase inhibitor-like protein [Candidatus Omnitrophota bacterium]MCF7897537.1 YbhB/YbcL family Raf kinase inhibitor-like protein [Candidatus Omnitrophota bacterium]MCF7909248.1 YbhB/YbcL family Raf kinase inhibitor-like protein [Candidatus Omnitrophota bacterium]